MNEGTSTNNITTALNPNDDLPTTSQSLISKGINLKVKDSSLVDKPICRICFGGSSRESLLKPCKCKGTIEFVHRNCLERWLGSTNYEACELCRFQYATIRIPKSFWEWCKQEETRTARRNIIADFICFLFLTPLGVGTMWLCGQGVNYYQKMRAGTIESVALIVLGVFLLLSYLAWVVLCSRYHFMMWRRWRARNCHVKVLDRHTNENAHKVNMDPMMTGGQSATSSVPLLQAWPECKSQLTQTNIGPFPMTDNQYLQVLSSINMLYDPKTSSI